MSFGWNTGIRIWSNYIGSPHPLCSAFEGSYTVTDPWNLAGGGMREPPANLQIDYHFTYIGFRAERRRRDRKKQQYGCCHSYFF